MNSIFIFDIDGVLTHPHIKKPNKAIVAFIVDQLRQGKPVALATGRAIRWIEKQIIPLVEERLVEKNNIDTLFISGEKGGVWIEFENGELQPQRDTSIHFPKEVVEKVRAYVKSMKGIFFDPDKYTMVSIEIAGGEDEKVIKKQKAVLQQVEKWLQKEILPKSPQIYMEYSEISIDLLVKGVDKRLAAKKILAFLEKKHSMANSFVMFGDSPSDALVCKELQKNSKAVQFFYVGKEPLPKQYDFPIIQSQGKLYDTAVVEFLQKYFSFSTK